MFTLSPDSKGILDTSGNIGVGREGIIEKRLQIPTQFPYQMAVRAAFHREPRRATPLRILVAGFARIQAFEQRPNSCESGYDTKNIDLKSFTALPTGESTETGPVVLPSASRAT